MEPVIKHCTSCYVDKPLTEFHSKRAQCKTCRSTYHKCYRDKNKEELRTHRDQYFKNLDPKIRWQRVRTSIMRCPESFLRDQLSHIGSHSRKPGIKDPKDPARREFNIDIEYVMQLWDSQKGICALTGLPMVHIFDSLYAVSIDRIDSSKGHIRGNIQLVCQCVNRMKNKHTNEEAMAFIAAIRCS